MSPLIDRRQKIDIIRDTLEERAFLLNESPHLDGRNVTTA
jgi:hypothetical protein